MRKTTLAVLICAAFACLSAQAATPRSSAKVVYVGHSLIGYDLPDMVASLAQSLGGMSYSSVVQVNPGTPIIANWRNCHKSTFVGQYPPLEFACDAIETGAAPGQYDTLIVTQVNNAIIDQTNPTALGSTPADFDNFFNLLLTRNPSGRAFFFAQWEEQGSPWHHGQEWTTQIAGEMTLIERMMAETERLEHDVRGRNVSVNIIPSNIALRDLVLATESGAFPGITGRGQLFADGVHMTSLGNYFLASVVFASVYERSPAGASGITKNRSGEEMTNLAPDLARRLQDFAWNVVARYHGWSEAALPQPPHSLSVK
jgi:hypothetical protein